MARGVGGHSPSNVARYLKGIDFPAKRDDLVRRARDNEAEEDVLSELGRMPDEDYRNMADVMKGYGRAH